MIKDCAEWANNIFSECNLGDKRLLARLIKIGGCLAAKVGSNLSSCFKGKNTDIVGAYRFIRNESVKPEAIKEFLEKSKIQLVFLPSYSPNLNLIERLWKFFRKKVLYNKYYEKLDDFRQASINFFKNIGSYWDEPASIMSDEFELA